jgi:hypothetical protein
VRRIQRRYHLYGVSLRCDWALPFGAGDQAASRLAEVEIRKVAGDLGRDGTCGPQNRELYWLHRERLANGSFYICWQDLFEFRVAPDGRRILAHALNETPWEVFHTYLLGGVISYALILQGLEPLHATVVVREGRAVALMGDCGHGKSSLAAACLRDGYQLLTDDLLIVRQEANGFLAYPGPPRIKLFPEVARALLGEGVQGVAMNQWTPKLIIPLNGKQYCRSEVPLKAVYVLRPPTNRYRVKTARQRAMSQRHAILALVANTFNRFIIDPARLGRQFDLVSSLATSIPIRSLTYPQDLDRVAEVVKVISKI